jgi:hypothetical protein
MLAVTVDTETSLYMLDSLALLCLPVYHRIA